MPIRGIFPLDRYPPIGYDGMVLKRLKEATMALETRSTDAKERISLPKAFANATVIIEQVNENELRIRKGRVIPEDELRFAEETPIVLSDRDRQRFFQRSIIRRSQTPR